MSSNEAKEPAEPIRMKLVFYGRVQGVGFRYRARYAADSLGLTGWVENEWDGSVRMEVQGSRENIYEMIRRIRQGTFVNVDHMDMKEIPPEDTERGFRVRGY
ncbi:MAG: acylphosphatase [Eubacteriales bacterium]|nr:acylphosphatase [Eubacteriales bacterium]